LWGVTLSLKCGDATTIAAPSSTIKVAAIEVLATLNIMIGSNVVSAQKYGA
jgi:hypothetical protein